MKPTLAERIETFRRQAWRRYELGELTIRQTKDLCASFAIEEADRDRTRQLLEAETLRRKEWRKYRDDLLIEITKTKRESRRRVLRDEAIRANKEGRGRRLRFRVPAIYRRIPLSNPLTGCNV